MEGNTDQLIKQKQERFKALGIPIPIDKPAFDQPVVNVKDPKMLQKIQEIKNGAKKREFNEILHVGEKNSFKPIPETKKRNTNPQAQVNAPQLENFAPTQQSGELDMFDKMFSAENHSYSVPSLNGSRIIEENNSDQFGTDFLSNFRQKLQSKAATSQSNSSNFGFNSQSQSPSLSLQEIESKIYEISSEVSQKIAEAKIKEVLDQYINKKTNLQENTFQKVKDDIIKIGDKYYKLTPVKVKSK